MKTAGIVLGAFALGILILLGVAVVVGGALHLYADHQHDDLMRAIQRQAIQQQQQQQAK